MIVSKDINPERDFYFLGAKVIQVLLESETDTINFFDIFEKVNNIEKISINLFTLTLDWLYIIGAVDKSKNGNLKRCF